MEWVEQMLQKILLTTSTTKPTTHKSMFNSVVQDQTKYYVDMPIVSTITNLEFISLIENLVETIE
jgi:hypothetical protein